MKVISSSLFAFILVSNTYAQIDNYQFKRKLNAVEKQSYYSIPLQPEVSAHCKSNLSDIRLYNIKENDTSEVPFLLEWMGTKNEQTTIPFELINDTYNEKCCSYVTLKFSKKQPINQIKLNVAESNFDKSLLIEGSNDNKQWFTICHHMRIVRFQNSEEDFSYTSLDFRNAEYTYFRLKFDDEATSRITVTDAFAFENESIQGNYSELKINDWKQVNNKKEKSTEIIVNLPFAYMINYITLKSNSKEDFYRNINVYGSTGTYHTPKGDKDNWYIINTSVFSSKENNPISCNNESTKKLKIEIINHDNEPVEISDIKAFGEQCRLIANLPASENIYLAYGKDNDVGPTYDMEHFKDKIPATLSDVTYGNEQVKIISIEKPNQLIENKKWLWIVMGSIIVIIGYFALSMLKKEQDSK